MYILSKHLRKHISYIISQSPNQNQPLQPTKRSTSNHFSRYPWFALLLFVAHRESTTINIPSSFLIISIRSILPAPIITRDVFLLLLNARPGSCASTNLPFSDLEFRTKNDVSVMGMTGVGARSWLCVSLLEWKSKLPIREHLLEYTRKIKVIHDKPLIFNI